MRIAATSMTPIQVIESFRTKLQSIGISSFMQVNFESANSKIICESESDACSQRTSETGKRLRRVTGGAPPRLGVILGVWPIPSAAAHPSGCVRGKKGRPPNGPPGRKPRGVPEGQSPGHSRASASLQGGYGILFDRARRSTERRISPPDVSSFVLGDDLPNECVLCRNTLYSGTCFQVSS